MAERMEVAEAEVIRVTDRDVTIRCTWASSGTEHTYIMVNGSVQKIPTKHRVVGERFLVRWGQGMGGYHGPMFAGEIGG